MASLTEIRAQYPQYKDMSDGSLADALHTKFYSDMPRDQFNTKLGIGAPQEQAPPQPTVGTGEDMLKAGASGLAQGVIGLAGMPGDIGSLTSAAATKLGSMAGIDPNTVESLKQGAAQGLKQNIFTAPFAAGPTSQDLTKATEQLIGPLYQAQTTPGKYAQTIGQFAPAMIGGPESLLTKAATRVVAPAVASEALGQATEGTAAEPYARVGGALLGGASATKIANKLAAPALEAAPALDQLAAHRDALYKSPEIAAIQIKPKSMQAVVSDLDQQLLQNKVDKFIAPTVSGILDRLKAPRFGGAGTIADFDLARQSLSDVPPNEMRAAAIVRTGIDKYLGGGIQQADLLGGDAAAANQKLLEARATHAAIKRSQDVTNAMGRAENQAGATYSGGNLENATRQQLKPILNQKQGVAKGRYFQDYTPEEIGALKNAVVGNPFGNAVRTAGKYLGGGGGLGAVGTAVAAGAAAHEAGLDPIHAMGVGFLSGLAGRGLNRWGNAMAVNRATALDELLRMRSPLGAPIAARNAQVLGMGPSPIHQQLTLPALLALQSQFQQANSR